MTKVHPVYGAAHRREHDDGCCPECAAAWDGTWWAEQQAEARIRELEAPLENTSVEVHTYIKQLEEAEDRLEAVKALHAPKDPHMGGGGGHCRACPNAWPCPTRRAAEGKP